MPVEMRLWRINEEKLDIITSSPLASESRLEEWLVKDLAMVSDDLLIVGNQLNSSFGGVLDILAIDNYGNLAILELKRDRTPRDIVAQVLHYAAWVKTLTRDQIEQIGTQYHHGVPFERKFQEKFGQPLPDTVNSKHSIYIVAAEIDAVSETIVRYLSEEYSIRINVVFFRYFNEAKGREYLGRSWLMEPSEVEERSDNAPSKQRLKPTFEEFEKRAIEQGVGPQYQALFEYFSQHTQPQQIQRTLNNVAFVYKNGDTNNAAFSMYPDRTTSEIGLLVDVRPDFLANAFSISEEVIRAGLPGVADTSTWSYGENRYFKTLEDAEKFINVLSKNTIKGTKKN